MKKIILISVLTFSYVPAFAKDAKKIDWKGCKAEIQEFCTTSNSDLEKHECLEEAPKGKLSKACSDLNKAAEKALGHKHEDGHKH